VASSYLYATARDFARLGLLALRGGSWDGRQVVPGSWIDHGRRPRSVDPDDGWIHGAHWWVVGDDLGSFWANGYEGQAILCVPGLDLVVVRLGHSSATTSRHLKTWRAEVVDAFRSA
jgi:CubicO group peptidase (beta-lactamase class C family)